MPRRGMLREEHRISNVGVMVGITDLAFEQQQQQQQQPREPKESPQTRHVAIRKNRVSREQRACSLRSKGQTVLRASLRSCLEVFRL